MAMIVILDGRQALYRYDTGVRLRLCECSGATDCHFAAPGGLIKREVVDSIVSVPDAALTEPGLLEIYAYARTPDGGTTRYKFALLVQDRPKPADYVDPPNEIDNLQALAERVAPLIPGGGGGVTPDQIGAAVEEYLKENPVEGKPGPQGPQGEPGPPGEDGSDATVTAENVASALGYTPASQETVGRLETTKADKTYMVALFEELKVLILAGNTEGAIAVLDQAILDTAILA